jgi:V8-like Glu-specific endopeptidase
MEVEAGRPIFTHDCSTLGDNSGSCVVDLQTGRVIGLHFRGSYRRTRYAVALWQLAGDSLLKSAGVRFD